MLFRSGPTSTVKVPAINPATGLPTGTGFGDEGEEYTTDSLGNVYKTMPDGTIELYRSADVPEDELMTDSLGNVFRTLPDGTYELVTEGGGLSEQVGNGSAGDGSGTDATDTNVVDGTDLF